VSTHFVHANKGEAVVIDIFGGVEIVADTGLDGSGK
jgi:hypothetical protein